MTSPASEGNNNSESIEDEPEVVLTEICPLLSYAGEGLEPLVSGKKLTPPIHLTLSSWSFHIPFPHDPSIYPFLMILQYILSLWSFKISFPLTFNKPFPLDPSIYPFSWSCNISFLMIRQYILPHDHPIYTFLMILQYTLFSWFFKYTFLMIFQYTFSLWSFNLPFFNDP